MKLWLCMHVVCADSLLIWTSTQAPEAPAISPICFNSFFLFYSLTLSLLIYPHMQMIWFQRMSVIVRIIPFKNPRLMHVFVKGAPEMIKKLSLPETGQTAE